MYKIYERYREDMKKIGILTFHYSNNYGGVLQSIALYKTLEGLGYEVEIINYIPLKYKGMDFIGNLGIRKNIFKNRISYINLRKNIKKISIILKHSNSIIKKFDKYREKNITLTKRVDEDSLISILGSYSTIIVGSDQIWNPTQRKKKIYFLDFGETYKGDKISYAADSTTNMVSIEDIKKLNKSLNEFNKISVRNEHSKEFVKRIINKDVEIVADPVLLYDFKINNEDKNIINNEYILVYVLGKEIEGSHTRAIEQIKAKYGDLPVYSIKIPTMNFELSEFADETFYDLSPNKWITLVKNAKFIYTDSFHGVMFCLKYHKPFLAYYNEELRAPRFEDLGKRYEIESFIVNSCIDIEKKRSLDILPDFVKIDQLIEKQKVSSLEFLKEALANKKQK